MVLTYVFNVLGTICVHVCIVFAEKNFFKFVTFVLQTFLFLFSLICTKFNILVIRVFVDEIIISADWLELLVV